MYIICSCFPFQDSCAHLVSLFWAHLNLVSKLVHLGKCPTKHALQHSLEWNPSHVGPLSPLFNLIGSQLVRIMRSVEDLERKACCTPVGKCTFSVFLWTEMWFRIASNTRCDNRPWSCYNFPCLVYFLGPFRAFLVFWQARLIWTTALAIHHHFFPSGLGHCSFGHLRIHRHLNNSEEAWREAWKFILFRQSGSNPDQNGRGLRSCPLLYWAIRAELKLPSFKTISSWKLLFSSIAKM